MGLLGSVSPIILESTQQILDIIIKVHEWCSEKKEEKKRKQ